METTIEKPKKKHGGFRVGAGKPLGYKSSHTLEIVEAKKRTIELVHAKIDEIVGALINKAVEGDVPAAKELFDRAWGKAKETIDVNANIKFSLVALAERARELEEAEFKVINPNTNDSQKENI